MASPPSIFTPVLDMIAHVKSPEGITQTEAFLSVCRLVLPVVDRFGAALSIVKSDIGGNITRLDTAYKTDTEAFKDLYNIVRSEVEKGTARGKSSNSNGLLWLTRAMDFLTAMLRNLKMHKDWTLYQAAIDSYQQTLKKYHGWIAASAFTMALNLCPDRQTFYEKLGPGDIDGDMEKFTAAFWPLLEENHTFLKNVGLDEMTAS